MSLNNHRLPTFIIFITWLLIIITLTPAILCLKIDFNILLEWRMLASLNTPLTFTLIIDKTRLLYSSIVLFISANVLTFSLIYIKEDKFIYRFTLLVVAFVVSMNMLIFIPHLIILLLGWDGLGVTSFILIIYYQNPKSLAAGLITALTNRIGDVAILMSIAWTLAQGHWNIIHISISSNFVYQILIIMLAAITKRAQIPFSSWLPAAIAAPTPVSALVHSSTLVTAGVFLLIRFYPFLRTSPLFNKIILFVAVSTLIISGFRACTECDIKKIIALSTLSQLGIIMTRIGLGLPNLAFIHIVIHALFKALLFICAGNIINLHSHAQDLRWMGNVSEAAPVTRSCLFIANSALCGLPFLSGFYSKDIIIETRIYNSYNTVIVFLIVFSVVLTSLYSIRFSIVTLWGPRAHKPIRILRDNPTINKPIVKISFISIISGSLILWIIPTIEITRTLPLSIKSITIIIVFLGIISGFFLSKLNNFNKSKIINTYTLHYSSCIIWFLVPLASQFILNLPLSLGHYILKYVDQAWIEIIRGQGIFLLINKTSSSISMITPRNTNLYILMAVSSILFIIPITTLIY